MRKCRWQGAILGIVCYNITDKESGRYRSPDLGGESTRTRRYIPFLLTGLILFLAVIAGSTYLARVNQPLGQRPLQELTVYTTLPAENAGILARAYEQESRIRVNFVPLGGEQVLARLQEQAGQEKPDAQAPALLLADRATIAQASAKGWLTPYVSEEGDQVPLALRQDEGDWTGVWYDPVVFCYNRDYLKTLADVPDTWGTLARLPDVRIGVTDFMAADAASNLFISMIAQYGDNATYAIWTQLHPKVVQYARYLSNPVRQAGMGEVDVAIAVESEALRYMQQGYPLRIVYPADGTAYRLLGTGIIAPAAAPQQQLARQFADWLLSDNAQLALQRQEMYFVPTNPGTLAYKMFAGKNLILFSQLPNFSKEQKQVFLDHWLKDIRFK